jgi:carboxymethylenebutenolidase
MGESWVTLPTRDGPMQAFLAAPDTPRRAPALVVLQEAYGVNDHIQRVCGRLATEGYVALAPDMFHRAGDRLTFSYDDTSKAIAALGTLDNASLETDVRAALAGARDRPEVDPRRVGTLGFCMGGFASFLAACRADPRTSVCFYPGGLVNVRPILKLAPLVGEIERIAAPVLLFFGESDPGIPPADVDRVRHELKGRDKVHEIVVYPGATHGFFCEARPSYHPDAASDAWTMTLGWLRERL